MLRRLGIACSAACLLLPLAGHAQSNDEGAQGQRNPDAPTTRASLEEVIVTARRRQESLQKTPIAVSAFSGEDLRDRGITNIKELTKSVPSLEITESVANLIYIRGIGQRTAFARVDPTVGVYLDNVFLPRADGQLLDTVDVENIQVLRGPQGTLFGKNTTGGAIVMTLAKPNDTREGYLSGSIGNYERRSLRGAINLPLSDSFYTRLSFNYVKDEGFFEDIDNDTGRSSKDRQSFLLQSRWDASADITMDSLLYYGRIREDLAAANCRVPNEDGLFIRGLYLMWPGDRDPTTPTAYRENCESNSEERLGDLKARMGANPQMKKDLDTVLLASTVDWRLTEDLALKLVAGARAERKGPVQTSDQDGGPQNFNESHNTEDSDRRSYSLELQLNGSLWDGAVTYTGGLFGMYETNTETFTLTNSLNGIDSVTLSQIASGQAPTQPDDSVAGRQPLVGILVDPILDSQFDLENQTLAAFLQASWQVTEQFEATFGIRWTEETRSSDLEVFAADRVAIGNRLTASGRFGPSAAFLDGAAAFNPFVGTWSMDPVGIAMSFFPDADGDGINDFPMLAEPVRTDEQEKIFRKITPMASLSYQFPDSWLDDSVIDSSMVYATWSTGFKSGFFEPKGVDGLQQVDPEEVENREIGFKLEAWRRSLRFNVAFYQMDFTDQQLIQVDADSANNLVVIFQNAGESEITGGEVEIQWMPFPGLMVNFSASSNDYEFTEFTDNDLLQAVLGRQVTVDRTDETFPVSPEDTMSFGIQQTFMTGFGTLTPRLDYLYKSEIYYGLDDGAHTAFEKDIDLAGQRAYSVVDLRLTWADNDGDLNIAAFVKNATDERYQVGIASVADSTATYFRTFGEPRMYGLEIRKTFN